MKMIKIINLISYPIIISNAMSYTSGKPDFIIIGAQKSGTTSLYNYLIQHPHILPAAKKELHFFDTSNFNKGINWYSSQFPKRKKGHLTGEATGRLLLIPGTAERVKKFFPDIKIIAILRDPVARAFSHYKMSFAKRRETNDFEAALNLETKRHEQDPKNLPHAYFTRGKYAEQLKRWFNVFPREQFLVLFFEEFFENPEQSLNKVFEFLNVPHYRLPSYEQNNKSRLPDLKIKNSTKLKLKELYKSYNEELAHVLERTLPW